jgi:hypothetical protein
MRLLCYYIADIILTDDCPIPLYGDLLGQVPDALVDDIVLNRIVLVQSRSVASANRERSMTRLLSTGGSPTLSHVIIEVDARRLVVLLSSLLFSSSHASSLCLFPIIIRLSELCTEGIFFSGL